MLTSRCIWRTMGISTRSAILNSNKRTFRSTPFNMNGDQADQTKEQGEQTKQQGEETKNENNTTQKKEEPKKEQSNEEKLLAEIKKTEKELAECKEKYITTIAEVENARKDTHRKVAEGKKDSNVNFAKSLGPFYDQLDKTIKLVKETREDPEEELKDVYNNVKESKTLLEKTFKDFGIVEYDPDGLLFDPKRHSALFQIPYFPGAPVSHVGQVINTGYTIKTRILRTANVGVFAQPPE